MKRTMRKKIILMQGLPASGKSTWTKEYCKEHPEFATVNRDHIRSILTAYKKINDPEFKWSSKFEEQVVFVELDAAKKLVESGKSLIVDDTNFAQKTTDMWEAFAAEHDLELSYEFINTPVNVCIARDMTRENSVGKMVILNMYKNFLKPKNEEDNEE